MRKSVNVEHAYGIDYEEDMQKKEKAKESNYLPEIVLN